MKCERISSLGTSCDLEAGHDGDHEKHYPDHPGYPPSRWNDDVDRRFVDRESRRGLGT